MEFEWNMNGIVRNLPLVIEQCAMDNSQFLDYS
jgi:hypothetical protein